MKVKPHVVKCQFLFFFRFIVLSFYRFFFCCFVFHALECYTGQVTIDSLSLWLLRVREVIDKIVA